VNSPVARVAAVLIVAAVVWKLPGGGAGAAVVLEMLGAAMAAAIIWSVYSFGRRHRFDLERLDDRERAIIYGTLGMAMLALAGRGSLWATVGGSVVWLLMVGATVGGGFLSWRSWQQL